jgi:3-oxoacyl-[acyl-carrier-protein] synthase II
VVSPAGVGLDALAGWLRGSAEPAQRGAADLDAPDSDPIAGDFPPMPLAAIPGLRVTDYLGKKGIRSLDRTTRLALVACYQALAGMGTPLTDEDRDRTGVVIGTSTGSIRSTSELCRDTYVQEKPYMVRVDQFPASVMNCCASQIAIKNSLHGVNATMAGGRASGLAAIRYARNAIARGHADHVLAGAVEELCPQSAWAWYRSGALTAGAAVGEGAAVFIIEKPEGAAAGGRVPVAELLGCETAIAGTGMRRALARCAERALERSGIPADAVTTVSLGATGLRGLEAAEEDAVRAALGKLPTIQLRPSALLGESFSATAALQIAAVLAAWRTDSSAMGPVALVTSIGHDNDVGCLVLRQPGYNQKPGHDQKG